MSIYYVYLTDETGAILTDETGALLYVDTYTKNPNPWRSSTETSPKARTDWGDNPDKAADVWRKTATKDVTAWGTTAKPSTSWRSGIDPKQQTEWSDL